MITKKWDEITRGSEVTLKEAKKFPTLGSPEGLMIEAGKYFIIGFWANLCGLSQNKADIQAGCCDIHIPAKMLMEFENITG